MGLLLGNLRKLIGDVVAPGEPGSSGSPRARFLRTLMALGRRTRPPNAVWCELTSPLVAGAGATHASQLHLLRRSSLRTGWGLDATRVILPG